MYQKIPLESVLSWRKIIGMRNAVVHNYLNLDACLLASVIKTKNVSILEIMINDID